MVAAIPAAARDLGRGIELVQGHPIHHEDEREAGIAMALSITPQRDPAIDLIGLCEELRRAAGLDHRYGAELRLETIFVVPYKGMAIEGYYWPEANGDGEGVLVRGDAVARTKLDGIVSRAGFPPRVLDETHVEHEISCRIGEPGWDLVWHDIRPIGDEIPGTVIDRAHDRFMAIHQAVIEHSTKAAHPTRSARRTTAGG